MEVFMSIICLEDSKAAFSESDTCSLSCDKEALFKAFPAQGLKQPSSIKKIIAASVSH